MAELPPLLRDQRKVDADHLRLLAVFHFIVAGLSIVGLGFLFLHYTLMHSFFAHPPVWTHEGTVTPGPDGTPNGFPPPGFPPAQFLDIFKWFYLIFGTLTVAAGIGNLFSGLFINGKKNRLFSLVVAGLNCIQFPFGTALGVFTFVVLLRDSVREIYEA